MAPAATTTSSIPGPSTTAPFVSSPSTALAIALSVLRGCRVRWLGLLLRRRRGRRRKRETLGVHCEKIRTDLQRETGLAPSSEHREELKESIVLQLCCSVPVSRGAPANFRCDWLELYQKSSFLLQHG
jgi:hypothetical protein